MGAGHFVTQQTRNGTVSLAAIVVYQFNHPTNQAWLVIANELGTTLGAAGLSQHATCPTFTDAIRSQGVSHVEDRFASLGRA